MTAPRYATIDPYLAAFLVCEGATLAGMRRITDKKVEYTFAAGSRLHVLLRTYWRGEPILVSPFRLFAAYRVVKSRSLLLRGGR